MSARDGLPSVRVVRDEPVAPADWDERAVHAAGGHVMQSRAWAEYRRHLGFEPRFLVLDDGAVALVLLRRSVLTPGTEATVRRGPAHRDDPPTRLAARARALARWAHGRGARSLFLDPERDADPAYEAAMDVAGFAIAEELEPAIHVMRLDLAGRDRDALFGALSKSTRQRVRAAQAAGTTVRDDGGGDRLEAFVPLMRERADTLGIPLRQGSEYLLGWRALLASGLARFLVAEQAGELVGGLFLHRHGGIHATVYSADLAARRRELPGTMHLLRWNAIVGALEAGARAIELGGVDLPGHRRPPGRDEPTWGLYEHKRGFGARWVDRSPARRMVLRPWAERWAMARRRAIDAARAIRRSGIGRAGDEAGRGD